VPAVAFGAEGLLRAHPVFLRVFVRGPEPGDRDLERGTMVLEGGDAPHLETGGLHVRRAIRDRAIQDQDVHHVQPDQPEHREALDQIGRGRRRAHGPRRGAPAPFRQQRPDAVHGCLHVAGAEPQAADRGRPVVPPGEEREHEARVLDPLFSRIGRHEGQRVLREAKDVLGHRGQGSASSPSPDGS
jgi:hypothetical protein